MLVTQHIKIEWGKECRGAPYAEQRSHMPKAFRLPKYQHSNQLVDYISHYVYVIQSRNGFTEKINRSEKTSAVSSFRLGALEILNEPNNCKIEYRYVYHGRAIPARRGFDYEHGGECDLIESAMELFPDEYGRIVYNGRFVDYDTGAWYYDLDIVNIMNIQQKEFSTNIFTEHEPDKTYNQLAVLY